jgi:hypothetical protein
MFVVRSKGEPQEVVLLWLAMSDGASMPRSVLEYVAEPVEAEGYVTASRGGLQFRMELDSLRRITE